MTYGGLMFVMALLFAVGITAIVRRMRKAV